MTIIGEAFIEVRPNTDGFGKETEKSVVGRVTNIAKKAAAIFAAAFAAEKVKDFFTGAISGASDLSESLSKNEVVFGQASAAVIKFSRTAATSLGQSQAQALEATGTFGNLLRAVGLTEEQSSKFSTSMVQLASDLASFNNASPTEALDALRSGLVGETEPLKRFGVNMNEAVLQAKALELGLTDGKGALDANAKAQAAYAVIMEQTSLAQGDFERTSGGLANQQRILASRFADLQARVGTALLPVMTKLVSFTSNSVLPAIERFGKVVGEALQPVVDFARKVITTLTGIGDKGAGLVIDVATMFGIQEDDPRLESFFRAMETVEDVLGNVVRIGGEVVAFVRDNLKPILLGMAILFAPLIITVPAGLIFLYVKFQAVRDVVAGVIGAFSSLVGFVQEVWPGVQEAVVHVMNVVVAVITTVLDVILAAWDLFGDDILKIVGAVWSQVQAVVEFAINTVANIIRLVLAVINGDWGKAWDALKQLVAGAFDFIVSTIKNIGPLLIGALGILWDLVRVSASAAWDGFKGLAAAAFDGIVEFVVKLPGRLLGLRSELISAALSLGGALIEGIGKGISGAVSFVGDIGKAVVNGIIGFINSQVIDRINRSLEFRIEVFGKGVDIDAPDVPRIPRLAKGALLKATAGGVPFIGAEAGRDEAVVPLPAGFLAAMQRIARGELGGMGRAVVSGPLATFQLSFGPGTNADDVTVAMRKVAREELQPVLERVVGRITAGTGTR